MKPLRLVVDCSGSVRGGIYRVLEQLEMHWNPEDELILVAAPEGFNPTRASIHSYQSGGRAKTLLGASRTINQLARHSRADGLLSLSPSITAAPSHVPVVTILHDLAYLLWPAEISPAQRKYRQIAYQANLRRSNVIRCVSQRTLHDLHGQMKWAHEVAKAWPLPTPRIAATPERSALVAELESVGMSTSIAVPGHSEHKGVELAIGGLAGLPASYGIVVMTRSDLVPHLQSLAAHHGVSHQLRFAVDLPDAQYGALLRDSSIVAMPSHFEGLGLPVLEARSFGARIVISPDPALLEAADGTATRMTTWTADAFANAIELAMTNSKPNVYVDPRTWDHAAEELRQDFLACRT